jgi:hypothetical protein
MSEIGVLLPVRLETRLNEVNGVWRLRLRVCPDEASILRQGDSVSRAEWDLLQRFWQRFTGPDVGSAALAAWLATDEGTDAWRELAAALLPARACTLATAHPPANLDAQGRGSLSLDPPGNGEIVHNRVNGFPESLDVWAKFKAQPAAVLLIRQPIAIDKLLLEPPELEGDPTDAPDPAQPERLQKKRVKPNWMNSWAAARDVGLGIECELRGVPQDLESLFVVGLGDASPQEHFQSRVVAGDFAVLSCGLPTNTVHGAPAVSLDLDDETWRTVLIERLKGSSSHLARRISKALTGDRSALSRVPGDNPHPGLPTDDQLGQSLVRALWSPLWGHALRDFWGLRESAERFSEWAGVNVFPEGPLPPIRLSDQPYGILPTSSLRLWVSAAVDPETEAIEKFLPRLLSLLRDDWARAARDGGNVVGGTTERMLELMARDGLTKNYGARTSVDIGEVLRAVTSPPEAGIERAYAEFESESDRAFQSLRKEFGFQQRHLLSTHLDYFRSSEMPLVVPTKTLQRRLSEIVEGLLEPPVDVPYSRWLSSLLNVNEELPEPPDSLLLRLLIWAAWFNQAALILQEHPDRLLPPGLRPDLLADGLLVEPVVMTHRDRVDASVSEYERLVRKKGSPGPASVGPAGGVRERMRQGLKGIARYLDKVAEDPKELQRFERVFSATLDSSMYRIDPFVTGLAWARLQQLQKAGATQRLGVYGWVDGWVNGVEIGEPGPSPNNLLHTPSRAQAVASIVLRDKYLFDKDESNARNPWEMNIESRHVRLAVELAEEVKVGSHLWEAVGRRVEQVFDDRDTVEKLRTRFPGRPSRPDTHTVCQGLEALDDLKPGNAIIPLAVGSETDKGLNLLRRALDVYGDLLVSEAVYQVVQGKADAAGAAMDAAVGLQRPPTLEFINTPRQGRSVQTMVLAVIPQHDLPPADEVGFQTSPGSLADPSVAAALVTLFGEPNGWIWEDPNLPDKMTLADLGLSPFDALSLGPEILQRIFHSRVPAADVSRLAGTGPENLRRAREFVTTIGRRMCLWRDIVLEKATDDPVVGLDDNQIFQDLLNRLRLLRQAAESLMSRLQSATASESLATDADRRELLHCASRWGIIPQCPEIIPGPEIIPDTVCRLGPTDVMRMIFGGNPAIKESKVVTQLAKNALEGLKNRLAAIPEPLLSMLPEVPGASSSKRPSSHDLAAAIVSLASSGGGVVVLSRMDRSRLVQVTGLSLDASVDLEPDWLSVVAAVRPPMARLEAWMLEKEELGPEQSLAARCNTLDPWLRSTIQENAAKKLDHTTVPQLVAAFGLSDSWDAATDHVAVGVIDAWNETVPVEQHATCAAFHFNAPASRPPQAILLAVPPDVNKPLDSDSLREIVMETRDSAHARAASPSQLSAWRALVPLSALPETGSTAFKFTR